MPRDIDEWTRLLDAARAHALEYRVALDRRRVAPTLSTHDMLERLDALGSMPSLGRPPKEVLDELVHLAEPGLTAMSGPRFFGWVTGGTLPAALVADWMATVWDQNAGPASGAPAASAFELQALRWVVELLRLPSEARGALVTGATMANFTALAAARRQVLEDAGWDVEHEGMFGAPPVRVLVGRERHDTVDKALRLLGFGKRSLKVVDADGQGRMMAAALHRELSAEVGPTIVCAQAGNVNSGAFDPLRALHDALADYRSRGAGSVWLHVDGAFGLWARACSAHAALADGAELADSWATDAHKFLNVPYDCGIVLTRHPRSHRQAMAVHGAYLSSGSAGVTPSPGVYAPELSRRARGFAVWAALRQLGSSGVEDLVTRCATHARRLAALVGATPGLRVLNEVVFNQVVVQAACPPGGDPVELTRALAVALQREGTCYATPTSWRGAPALRFSVINAETDEDDITQTAAAIRAIWSGLQA